MKPTAAVRSKLILAATLAGFGLLAFLLFFRQTAVTPSFDEMIDDNIVRCYLQTLNPFSCPYDITQTRLPYYLHALIRGNLPLFNPIAVDRTVSAIFILATVFLLYRLTKREFGGIPAALFVLLAATSVPVLASGRMSLTHANAIFVFLSVASIVLAWKFSRDGKTGDLLAASICFGLSVAASLNGVVTAAFFIILGRLLPGRRIWSGRQLAMFFAVSVAVFFAASPIHLIPANLTAMLIDAGDASMAFPKFNYMGTGAASAPWWFSIVLFFIKLSPWWALLFFAYPAYYFGWKDKSDGKRLLTAFWCFVIFFLFVKSTAFRYDAPHHQTHVSLLALVIVAASLPQLWSMAASKSAKLALAAALSFAFAVQAWLIWLFFPNLLYFGAQYGARAIGEFYGPASVICQDMGALRERVYELLASGSEVRATRALCWLNADRVTARYKDAYQWRPSDHEFRLFLEGITAFQMNQTAEERAAVEEIFRQCRLESVRRFPLGFPAYMLYDCPAGTKIDPSVMVRLELMR